MARKALSKRTRFEIFKRDGFQCIYCGVTPERAVLRVDHVKPVAEGGGDEPENLVTACHDCNAGKGPVPLEQRKHVVGKATEEAKEQPEQIREWLALQREMTAAKSEVVAALEEQWGRTVGYVSRNLTGKLPGMVQEFGAERMAEAIDIVAQKRLGDGQNQVRYLCGIARNWRTEGVPKVEAVQPAEPEEEEEDQAAKERDLFESELGILVSEIEAGAHTITPRTAVPIFWRLFSSVRRAQIWLNLTVGTPARMDGKPISFSPSDLERQDKWLSGRLQAIYDAQAPELFECGGGL